MRILVSGASGLVGSALVPELRSAGHEVVRLVRRAPSAPDEAAFDPGAGRVDQDAVDRADAVVNLSGAGVAAHRWTPAYKRVLRSSRVGTTDVLARAVAAAGRPALVNASAIGFYGDTGDQPVDEGAPSGRGFLAGLCRDWEAATGPASAAGARVCHLRTGLVLSGSGGTLGPLLPLFRLGLGGQLGSGRQYWSTISLVDEVRAITFAVTSQVSGALNLTGPAPTTNAGFTSALGALLQRPTVLPVPAPALRVVLGEFAGETTVSQRVLPAALLEAGFRFEHPDLASSLRAALAS